MENIKKKRNVVSTFLFPPEDKELLWLNLKLNTLNHNYNGIWKIIGEGHFATLSYVDNKCADITSYIDNKFLPYSGGTMTGKIVFHNGTMTGTNNDVVLGDGTFVSKSSITPVLYLKTITSTSNTYTITDLSGTTTTITIPEIPTITDKYHTTGTWSGLTYTATAVGNADPLAFTIPIGTTALTVALGNHTHSEYITEDKYHTTGTWSGLTYTATSVGSAEALAFTIPTGTTSTTVALGNHNHDTSYLKKNVNETTTGTLTASSFYQSSDIRLKNIKGNISIVDAYELIDKCLTILYTLKSDELNKLLIGVIALEVEIFFPEIVNTDENGFKSVDYSRLTVIMLKVLKDLINRIHILEEK